MCIYIFTFKVCYIVFPTPFVAYRDWFVVLFFKHSYITGVGWLDEDRSRIATDWPGASLFSNVVGPGSKLEQFEGDTGGT